MITGAVNADYEAVIRLRVQGSTGHVHEVDAIIDTGFNGFLTLPPALVTALGLTRLSRGRALLANGSEELFDIYGVTVLWDGQQRYVEADAVGHHATSGHVAAGGLRSPPPGRGGRAGGYPSFRTRQSVLTAVLASTGISPLVVYN
jgi:clan AA aspartic protease